MADNQDSKQNLNSAKTNTFVKGLYTDYNDSYVPDGVWINAINAVTSSHKGDSGTIGNEPSNNFCAKAPFDVIGIIRKNPNEWVIFSTNDVLSEIGIFKEDSCTYTTVIKDKCLSFKRSNLITGYIQYNFDCSWSVYWADGLNPDRTLNLDNIPYIVDYTDLTNPSCPVKVYTECLDCEKIRLNFLSTPPCYSVNKAVGAGSLLNGSYQAVLAYSINGQRVTNYFTPSNLVGLWSHSGIGGGLEITISSIDTDQFEEYELVIVSTINSQTTARIIGYYSTRQTTVYLDLFSEANQSVDLIMIPLITPVYEKCDKIFQINGYLLRSGISTKFQFNYQPLANQITTKWQEVVYPSNYYRTGGVNTSYMRDEQYAFFIRWIYNDGDKSASYHIPGRAPLPSDLVQLPLTNNDVLFNNTYYWETYNTATVTDANVNQPLSDGGTITREGTMGYWESSELYPDNKPEVWGDLCGKPIRHHKMPDSSISHIHDQGGGFIYVLGVKFDNIVHPKDNNGTPIPNIIGYEILRGSREGNRTVIAKGLLNNMRGYNGSSGSGAKYLYQNYPFNDLNSDYFLTSVPAQNGENPDDNSNPLSTYYNDYFSFHSPETNFNKPFLNINEVKLYTKEYGGSRGTFNYVYGHPKEKLITQASLAFALFVGLGTGMLGAVGGKDFSGPPEDGLALASSIAIAPSVGGAGVNPIAVAALSALAGAAPQGIWSSNYGTAGTTTGFGNWAGIQFPTVSETSGDLSSYTALGQLIPAWSSGPGRIGLKLTLLGLWLANCQYYIAKGTGASLDIIYNLVPFRQYAVQVNSHGFYSKYKPVTVASMQGKIRREYERGGYIKDQIQEFDSTYTINNLYRNNYVALKIKGQFDAVSAGDASIVDNSRKRIRDLSNPPWINPNDVSYAATTSAYYVGLKVDYVNQYGQLDGIVQIPVETCYNKTVYDIDKTYTSHVIFGGDVYINRYTEKNPFFYFTDWLYDVPNGTTFNYPEYYNPLYPRYWANFDRLDSTALKLPGALSGLESGPGTSTSMLRGASAMHHLDRNPKSSQTNTFLVTSASFYLFNNGVRDFFVESEVNLAFRDYGDLTSERFYDYDGFTDLTRMFRSDIIKSGNYYKYDYSLSLSKTFNNYLSFGAMLPKSYNPLVSETCYSYIPTRLIYSLQQQSEQKRESWRVYLPNNYKDFENVINHVKPINRTGSIILFEDAEPTSITGVDELKTGAGTKITIGDAGLFAQPFQSLINADDEYEYGSSQDTRAVINTTYGMFYMSRGTAKILQLTGGQLIDISMNGMRAWFSKYLPNILTTYFPNFPHTENTAIGIGCTSVFDNQYEILYFSKRDFKPKGYVKYNEAADYFYIERQTGDVIVELGDPIYFEDCSWTISYDPKTKMWLSFHDWHPNFTMGTNDHFYTVKDNGFWQHNVVCNSYCNFYGKDYKFEVEFPMNTGAEITTIKSIEYTLEVLNYSSDCIDPYHVLDANFDYAMLYNTEQNSGLLKLNLMPKSPVDILNYPVVNANSIDILFSKKENKYRFNQFWDATRDRGEYTGNQYRMFDTEQNGYKKSLNSTYINYAKSPLQRKKFRHYGNRLILGKTVSNNLKYNLKVVNTKETQSPR